MILAVVGDDTFSSQQQEKDMEWVALITQISSVRVVFEENRFRA